MARHLKDATGRYLWCGWPGCPQAVTEDGPDRKLCPEHGARLPLWPQNAPPEAAAPGPGA